MRTARRAALSGLVVGLAIMLSGCAGGLGEAGLTSVEPPPPPNFNDPIFKAKLAGQVSFDPDFLHHHLLARPAMQELPEAGNAADRALRQDPLRLANSSSGTVGGAAQRDRAFYSSLRVRITGKRGTREVDVREDGEFDFGTVRAGDWKVEVLSAEGGDGAQAHLPGAKGRPRPRRRTTGVLAISQVELEGKSTTELLVRILGTDLVDLDGDGSSREFVVEREVQYRSELVQYRRVFHAGGDVWTFLADGSREVLGTDGRVRVFRADGAIEDRLDPENRFVDEELEPDHGSRGRRSRQLRRRLPGGTDPLEGKVSGEGRVPLVVAVDVERLGSPDQTNRAAPVDPTPSPSVDLGPGDLARLTARVDSGGGPAVTRVSARVGSAVGRIVTLDLHDDGGTVDLRPTVPGFQSSLDRKKGDDVFTAALLLDTRAHRFLASSEIAVRASSQDNHWSRSAIRHMYLAAPGSPLSEGPELVGDLADVRLEFGGSPGRRTVLARVLLKSEPETPLTARLIDPAGQERLLTVGTVKGRPALLSTSGPLGPDGLYTVHLSDGSGRAYYTGQMVHSSGPARPVPRAPADDVGDVPQAAE